MVRLVVAYFVTSHYESLLINKVFLTRLYYLSVLDQLLYIGLILKQNCLSLSQILLDLEEIEVWLAFRYLIQLTSTEFQCLSYELMHWYDDSLPIALLDLKFS